MYSHNNPAFPVDTDEPGHMDIAPEGNAGGGTIILAPVANPDGDDIKYSGNLYLQGNNYSSDSYSFGLYFDAEGNNPVPNEGIVSSGTNLYYILS